MALTITDSDISGSLTSQPAPNDPPNREDATLHMTRFVVTQGAAAGDDGSSFRLCTLPQRARILPMLCRVRWSAFGAARVLSVGYEQYRNPVDGSLIVASPTALGTALDVSAAGRNFLDTLTNALEEYEFVSSAMLTATVTGGTIPAGAIFAGCIVYGLAY